MAQTAYTGIQGSGKSYEVVRGVIIPAVANGRRVVTNVAGLKEDLIKAYCVDRLGVDPAKLGSIVKIENDDVTKPNFFPIEKTESLWQKFTSALSGDSSDELAKIAAWNAQFIVQPGDLIVLDEVWRWYVTGERLPNGHLTFFRMHRHFLHPVTGQCCDVVLITQVLDDLQRKIKGTIEKNFLMRKHKDLGFPDRYVINIYSGNRQNDRALIETKQEKYNPEIFELYTSYSQSNAVNAKEDAADSRGNLFNRPLFKIAVPFAVIAIIGVPLYMWRFFHPTPKEVELSPQASSQAQGKGAGGALPSGQKPTETDEWRVVGYYFAGADYAFVLSDGFRNRVVYRPPSFKVSGLSFELALPSGEIATSWGGRNQKGPGEKK